MTNLSKVAPILSGFAIAGLAGCLINIREAMPYGMGVAWLVIMGIFFLSLSELNSESLWLDFITKSGMSFVTVVLIGFYYFCVMKNREYVQDGLMPDVWYTFSYFVVFCTAANVVFMVNYFDNYEPNWNSLLLLGNTLLFAFIVIEWIICTFYRTDGFRV
jgi:hypothetical protein